MGRESRVRFRVHESLNVCPKGNQKNNLHQSLPRAVPRLQSLRLRILQKHERMWELLETNSKSGSSLTI